MSLNRPDLKAIKQDYPIQVVAKALGLNLTEEGETLRCPCPSTKGDKRSLVIFPRTWKPDGQIENWGGWKSHASNDKGGVVDLVMFCCDLTSLPKAGNWILDNCEPQGAPKKKARREFDIHEYLEALDYEHEVVAELGLEPDEAKTLGVGVAVNNGIHKNKLVICLRDEDGNPIVCVRAEDITFPRNWR